MSDEKFTCPRRMVNLDGEARDTWVRNRWDSKAATFPKGYEKPRTCTWCGGIHPDDAIALIGAGFRLEETDKGYKFYMHPVDGTYTIPPIKLYLAHFSNEQVAHADEIIRAQSAFAVAENPTKEQLN
jgi:hypothetical protein